MAYIWIKSYRTLKLDTPSEKIEEGYYAIIESGESYLVQEAGEEPKITKTSYDVSSLIKANIVGDTVLGDMYVNEFKDDGDVKSEDKVTAVEYEALKEPGADAPTKKP